MATVRIEDEQVSVKGYADGLCGFADLRTDRARSTGGGRSTVTTGAFNLKRRCYRSKSTAIFENAII